MNQALLRAAKRLKASNREAYLDFVKHVGAERDAAINRLIAADPTTVSAKQGRAQQATDFLEHLNRCDEIPGAP